MSGARSGTLSAMTHPSPHPRKIVTRSRKPTRHGLHLVLAICTGGAWALTGWPIAWAWNTWGPRAKSVQRYS